MPEDKTTVLFIWEVNEKLIDHFRENFISYSDIELIFPENDGESSLLKYAPESDIMVGWRPTEKLLEKAENLSLFINPGAGVQHLIEKFRDINRRSKVTLINNHGNSYFTAQHGVAILLAVMNKVISHHNWMVEGRWRMGDSDASSIPLRDRRVGLLGYGAVNQQIHQMMSGFEVEFLVLTRNWEKHPGPYPTEIEKYRIDDLTEFLKSSDILIISVPLTENTRDMIGSKELELLGAGGLLVNLARGGVVNEESLYKSLRDGVIAGASIDVWYEYSPHPDEDGKKYPFHYPFHQLDNVVLSPHRGASPFSDLRRWDGVIDNIKRFARGRGDFINVVDLEEGY